MGEEKKRSEREKEEKMISKCKRGEGRKHRKRGLKKHAQEVKSNWKRMGEEEKREERKREEKMISKGKGAKGKKQRDWEKKKT